MAPRSGPLPKLVEGNVSPGGGRPKCRPASKPATAVRLDWDAPPVPVRMLVELPFRLMCEDATYNVDVEGCTIPIQVLGPMMLRMRNLVSNRFALLLLLPVATLCAACSSSSSSGPEDASPDSPFDAPSAEGGTDSRVPDSTLQPSADGATDASKDASLDAPPEAEARPIVACVRGDPLCVDGGVVLCGPGGDWDGGTSTCPNGTACSGNRCSSTIIGNAGAVSA